MHSLSTTIIVLALLSAPNTERADCGNAQDRYAAAAVKVIGALRSYETCIAASVKRRTQPQSCSAELQALDNAHDDLADAAADAKDCD